MPTTTGPAALAASDSPEGCNYPAPGMPSCHRGAFGIDEALLLPGHGLLVSRPPREQISFLAAGATKVTVTCYSARFLNNRQTLQQPLGPKSPGRQSVTPPASWEGKTHLPPQCHPPERRFFALFGFAFCFLRWGSLCLVLAALELTT